MKVRIVVIDDFPDGFKDTDEFEEATKSSAYEVVSKLSNSNLIDFEIRDDIDEENLSYICYGRTYLHWFNSYTDFYSDYYQSWSFKQDGDKWVLIQ